jgi:hypothetical protein
LSVIVILLLAVIGEVYYFGMGKSVLNTENLNTEKTSKTTEVNSEKVEVVIVTDKRCGEKCNVQPTIAQLKQIPSLANNEIKVIDYSEKEAKEILKATGITKLPAVIFSNNSVSEVASYLAPTSD